MRVMKRIVAPALCAWALLTTVSGIAHAQRAVSTLTRGAMVTERRIIDAQAKRLRLEQSAMRTYTDNVRRARAETVIQQQVRRAETVAAGDRLRAANQTLRQRFSQVNNPGVVYLRRNPVTQQYYVGRSKDTLGYLRRQRSHDRAFIKVASGSSDTASDFTAEYMPIATASSHESLRVAEETAIRYYQSLPGVSLSNARHEMSAAAYSSAVGGHTSLGGGAGSASGGSSLTGAFSAASGAP